jgi:hypothetical protein
MEIIRFQQPFRKQRRHNEGEQPVRPEDEGLKGLRVTKALAEREFFIHDRRSRGENKRRCK